MGALLSDGPRHTCRALLFDLTIVNLWVITDIKIAARQTGTHFTDEVRPEEKIISSLVPRFLLLSSLYVDVW